MVSVWHITSAVGGQLAAMCRCRIIQGMLQLLQAGPIEQQTARGQSTKQSLNLPDAPLQVLFGLQEAVMKPSCTQVPSGMAIAWPQSLR